MNDEVSPIYQLGVVVLFASVLLGAVMTAFITVRPLFDKTLSKFQNSMTQSRYADLSDTQAASFNTAYQGVPKELIVATLTDNLDDLHSICYIEAVRITDGFKTSEYNRDNADYPANVTLRQYATNESIFTNTPSSLTHNDVLETLMKSKTGFTRYTMYFMYDKYKQTHVIIYPFQWEGLCEEQSSGKLYNVPTGHTTNVFEDNISPTTIQWIEQKGKPNMLGGDL